MLVELLATYAWGNGGLGGFSKLGLGLVRFSLLLLLGARLELGCRLGGRERASGVEMLATAVATGAMRARNEGPGRSPPAASTAAGSAGALREVAAWVGGGAARQQRPASVVLAGQHELRGAVCFEIREHDAATFGSTVSYFRFSFSLLSFGL